MKDKLHTEREKNVKIYSQLKIEKPVCKTKPCIDSLFQIFQNRKKFNKCKKNFFLPNTSFQSCSISRQIEIQNITQLEKRMKQEYKLKYSVKKSNFYMKIPFKSKCHLLFAFR